MHNQYASDKVLPLTVACHFKVSPLDFFFSNLKKVNIFYFILKKKEFIT